MAKSKSLAPQPLVVPTYEELGKYIRAFVQGHLGLMILTGGPGLGKSHELKVALGPEACVIEGNTTAFGMYLRLYAAADMPVLIDDVDSLYRNRDAVRLLKCLCQTDPLKTISWNSDARTLVKKNVPSQFQTTSKVAIVANDWQQSTKDILALGDRGHLIHFDPDAAEVRRKMAEWFWDQEVFDFLGERLQLIRQPSFRHYIVADELKQAGLDWREAVLARCLSGKLLVVAQLKASDKYATEEHRAQAFIDAGHGCRATYFNLAKKLPPLVELPRLTVRGTRPEVTKPLQDLIELLKKRHGRLGDGLILRLRRDASAGSLGPIIIHIANGTSRVEMDSKRIDRTGGW
jgi:hypothetical protein